MAANIACLFTITTFVLLAISPSAVDGHGRLIEPPSRATAWRYGFNTPANYNDHELYCGGFTRQWTRNGGKCGVCGDAWDAKPPRANEFGGRYGQGVIVRKYPVAGTITIRVQVTANHNGYFEFRICPDFKNTTQECLDQNLLKLAQPQNDVEPHIHRFFPNDGNRIYNMTYYLPNIECEHCVLQWRYIAGNNWGTCPDNTSAVGCGPQEEFRACADIQIGNVSEVTVRPTVPFRKPGSRPPYRPTTSTTRPEVASEEPHIVEPESSGTVLVGLLIALIAFVVVIVALVLLYFYYYHSGHTWTSWLKKNANRTKLPPPPPIKPPRTKHIQRQLSYIGSPELQTESLA